MGCYSSYFAETMRRFYVLTRDLHLYFGLFISPFVLLFAVSVIFLVHAWIPGNSKQPLTRTATGVALPETILALNGRPQVEALRPILDRLKIAGEVNFVRRFPKELRLLVPVQVPGRET